jgi:asparagine synthase (glutamine-hydrolysing)
MLDHRIVEMVISMLPRMKFKGAEMKYILKKAVKDILPEKIYQRKDKMGFPVPLHIWARNNVRGFFKDVLLDATCRERGLFNTTEVEKLIENEDAFGRRLWGLLNLELWFRRFID